MKKHQIPSYKNIENYFYQNFGIAFRSDANLAQLFVSYEKIYPSCLENPYQLKPIFLSWKTYTFPVFIHQNQKMLFDSDGKISFDIYLNVFIFLSGFLELECKEKDIHDRFPYIASLQKKYQFTQIPIVNIYFELLYEAALNHKISIKRHELGQAIVFTHDIDQFRSAWFENIQFYLKNFQLKSLFEIPRNIIIKLLKLNDGYFLGMEKMLAIDEENEIEAISFFIPKKSKMDADFNWNDKRFHSLLKRAKHSQTIGLHPGYYTYKDSIEFEEQKKMVETFYDTKISKSRQHFLRYDMQITPYIIEKNQIDEEYSLGFAEQYGFRNGIANPFYLFNFQEQKAFSFKSIPLVFMDVSLSHYQNNSDTKKIDKVAFFLKQIKKDFNCHFSVLFHNSVFSDSKFKGYADFYKKLLDISK